MKTHIQMGSQSHSSEMQFLKKISLGFNASLQSRNKLPASALQRIIH